MFLGFLRIPTYNQYKIKIFCSVKNTRAHFDFLKVPNSFLHTLIRIKCLDIRIVYKSHYLLSFLQPQFGFHLPLRYSNVLHILNNFLGLNKVSIGITHIRDYVWNAFFS